jgi:hypothetical protein
LFDIEIRAAGNVQVGDLSHVTADVSEESKRLEQFVNIASAQPIFQNVNYLTYSLSRGYMCDALQYGFIANETPVFPSNSSTLSCGFNKSVLIIEGLVYSYVIVESTFFSLDGPTKFPTGVAGCSAGTGLLVESKKV